MDFIDYYKILEINRSATAEDIRRAYRKLARKLHPDLNPNDAVALKQFQQINEANQVLSDPEKRKKYDQYGKDWEHAGAFEQQRRSSEEPSRSGSFSGSSGDFSGFFESLFGGSGAHQSTPYRGQDYHAELKLDLIQALITHPQTLVVDGKNIRITIPAGVEDGQVIKLNGYGGPGAHGGPAGDLLITFVIARHPRFARSGNDLYSTVSIDLYTALLGGEISFVTLGGEVKLKIKPETQPGARVRLKGKGFPVYKKEGAFGDLYITIEVKLPVHLNDQQKTLFTELSKLQPS